VIDEIKAFEIANVIDWILFRGVSDIKLSVNTKAGKYCEPNFQNIHPDYLTEHYSKYPILNYRINRFLEGKPMRGIPDGDNFKCSLVKTDISILGNKHYPCLVYAREKGQAIGELNDSVYADRLKWYEQHQPSLDPICKKYCMDFKCEFNRSKNKLDSYPTK
jgi:hypothetical protein